MNQPICDDVRAEVEAFVEGVRRTLDPDRGPEFAHSDAFERRLGELDSEFTRLKRTFHDYIVTGWSSETARELRRVAASSSPPEAAIAVASDRGAGPAAESKPLEPAPPAWGDDARAVGRSMWCNWLLLAGTGVATICGLVVGILPLVRARAESPWPWRNTESALLLGLSLAIAILMAYLTRQQRVLTALQTELAAVRDAAVARMRRHCDRLLALLEVSRTMGAETEVDAIFDRITMTCMRTFECEQVSLMTLDSQVSPPELIVRSAAGHADLGLVLGSRRRLGEGIAGYVAQRREPRIVGPAARDGGGTSQPQLTASMVVPIEVRGELVGVLNIGTRRLGATFDEEDLRALQVFAGNAGASIRHAEQTTWMRQTIATLQRSR